METGGLIAMKNEEKIVPESQVKELEMRIRQLERMLSRQTLHNEILKEAVKIGREKTHLATTIARSGQFRIRPGRLKGVRVD